MARLPKTAKPCSPEHAGYPEQQSQQELSRGTNVHVSTESVPGHSVGGEPTKDGADGETAQVKTSAGRSPLPRPGERERGHWVRYQLNEQRKTEDKRIIHTPPQVTRVPMSMGRSPGSQKAPSYFIQHSPNHKGPLQR